MATPRLSAATEYPRVIRSRTTDAVDVGTIYGHSKGGIAPQPAVLNRPERQNFTQQNFQKNYMQDTLIKRTRKVLFRDTRYRLPGDGGGNHNWTADGPVRDIPTFRANRNYRPIVGGAHPDMWGQHTNIQTIGQNALEGKARMRPSGQNKLTVQRYRGQSYSQTTNLAGQ